MTGETTQNGAAPSAASGQSKGGLAATIEADETAVANKAAAIERAVQAWLTDHIRNSPVSRATAAWNHLTSKVPDLIAYIEKEI